jgi:hypothetical protein
MGTSSGNHPAGGSTMGRRPWPQRLVSCMKETGLRLFLTAREAFPVARDVVWAGTRHRHLEMFFLARLPRTVEIDPSL